MHEQHRQILRMLAEGNITAAEAEQLIDALQGEQPEPPPSTPKSRPKYLRVMVSATGDTGTPGTAEPSRVNVRVPLQLLRAGVRLTTLIPPQALTKVNAELHRSGVPIDLTELKPQHIEDLIDQLDEVSIYVTDADTNVQVFCE